MADHSWQPAGFLHIGEPIVTADGAIATVAAVRVVPGAARMWDLTVANVHTFAVGASQAVVHNCGGSLAEKAEQAAASEGRVAGAATEIRGQSGEILFEDAVASGPTSDAGPFGDIIRSHQGDEGTGCFAGGCAETRLARRILQAADENPRMRGRFIRIALFHGNEASPCPTCTDVLQNLADRMGSRIQVETNAGRIFGYWPH
jgi:hypothetical protein